MVEKERAQSRGAVGHVLGDGNRIESRVTLGGEPFHERHEPTVVRSGCDRGGRMVGGVLHVPLAEGLSGESQIVFEETHACISSHVRTRAAAASATSPVPVRTTLITWARAQNQ